MTTKKEGISYVIPVYNEEKSIGGTLERLKIELEKTQIPFELIVVNDGSKDDSAFVAKSCKGIRLVSHPVNCGYGTAIKSGIRIAQYEWIGIVDADGTYNIELLPKLVEKMKEGFDMVIAKRKNALELDGSFKRIFRRIFIATISLFVGKKVEDPNSGFRIFRRSVVEKFGPFLCQRFSFTTSLTIFTLGEGLFVSYVPMEYGKRVGTTKVRHFRDSISTVQLVIQGICFFNPSKFFLLLIFLFIILVALPAIVLDSVGWPSVAFYYFWSGAVASILSGVGLMCDTLRIAIFSNKK